MIRILLSIRLGERRMTQAELARLSGVRAATINDLYHEMADRVSLEQLDRICEVLGIDLDELIVRLPTTKRPHCEVCPYDPSSKRTASE